MIIEGINAVTEALNGGLTVEKVCVQKGVFADRINRVVAIARANKIKVVFEDRAVLDKLSPSGKHQGVIATATEFVYTDLEELMANLKSEGKPVLLVILDGVEDPHNLGAVIRVADCAGAQGVIIPKNRGALVNDTVLRTSAGATAYVPVCKVTNVNDAIKFLQDNGVFVFAADMDGASVYDTDLTGNVAVVIGGEGKGVHTLTRKVVDDVISLPQCGKVNSLNASVACGIILYEAVRQRIK